MKPLARTPGMRTIAAMVTLIAATACAEPTHPGALSGDVPSFSHDEPDRDAVIPVTRTILPIETSESGEIDWMHPTNPAPALHYVWRPARKIPHARLFLFLPGANNRPLDYELISGEAARVGHHVIGLVYQNDRGVDAICKPTLDPTCTGSARMEILTGQPVSSLVTVTEGNSIDHRVERVLIYLDENYPDEGWDEFLIDGRPDWAKITVAGQSQGAGQAALIARERRVARVVMLSGPPDQVIPNAVDEWVRIGATSAKRMYALHHFNDHLRDGIRANLGVGGLDLESLGAMAVGALDAPTCTPTDPRPVEDRKFRNAHLLVTNLVPQGGCIANLGQNPHRSTSRDDFTPLLADGKPALLGAWRHLIGDPSEKPEWDGDRDEDDR